MILQRPNLPNISEFSGELKKLIGPSQSADIVATMNYYQLCRAAVNEVGTKLDNLDSEYQLMHAHNPIHHMEERMKDGRSLAHKLEKKGLKPTFENVKDNIFDIGGLRVITNYIEDVYTVEKNLLAQDDVTLLRRKDYIKTPKPSGYRSLHLVVSVPVFQSSGSVATPVEIQLRTVGMDMWASLEHQLRYKTDVPKEKVDQYGKQLVGYAQDLSGIEENLQRIFLDLNQSKLK